VSIVEITTFRLADGVSDARFLALDRRVQTELVPNQPGFLRRTTARHGPDWVVVTLWGSADDAAAYQRTVSEDPLQREFEGTLEAGTFHQARYTTLD
jgi:heme-degrading monooxygenase HmoA